ncbi:DUF3488 and transglutaminase-like domain-containing protein [Microbacterium sp.]|uniref:transglutaminase family protein n=1 Tax=Microbacterium sp. TaxID=51671 RepID=UPI002CCA63F5|nr:DUF3488 and transglutaminase-like domain-containing protein [Microbacterium sp.]HWL76119.1 DUF3488 and transglutaminase-like domain-containing protein [Microbacterium sp.]
MSSSDRDPTGIIDDVRAGRRGADLTLTAGVLVAVLAALLPLMRVVRPSGWLLGAVILTTGILASGYVARRYRLAAIAVSLIEAAVWVVFVSLVFLRDTALLWMIPTPETITRQVPRLVGVASEEIALGAAPLEAGVALSFLIVATTGLLTIVIDHVVLTARMPLLAAIGLIAVSLIPAIAVPSDLDVMAFVLLAAAILFLMRADTRARERQKERDAERTAGVPATALGIGAIAVVVAVVASPLLPQPTVRAGAGGLGPGTGIDVTLELGDDLRRPREIEVLVMRSNAPTPPYLRVATLTGFDGAVWNPDRVRSVPLDGPEGLSEISVAPNIDVAEYRTNVVVLNLSSPWLPVSYPAVEVTGLTGQWAAVPYNRTVTARSGSTQGQVYEVVSHVPRPTLEQIRARPSRANEQRDETTQIPTDLPPIVAELAQEVTADAATDYDRLIALQSWFRSSEFQYSLEAPVEDGFDGTGAEAVARFLEARAGYCVHFASAFALMARTLGMPSRIVVGYLPGEATTDAIDRQTVYTVTSGRLHAWPEVYFDGIGWVQFEPTNSLGTPTAFSPAASQGGPNDPANPATPLPSTAPSSAPGLTPDDGGPNDSGSSDASATGPLDLTPAATVVLGILFALAIPGLVREMRRRQLLAAARTGDAASAWTIVQDVAIDLGVSVPASESARSLGARLVEQHGAPPSDMSLLISAIERASYAPGGKHGFWQGEAIANAAVSASRAMLAEVELPRRILAILAPRSLVIRPGSLYAGAGARVGARLRARP